MSSDGSSSPPMRVATVPPYSQPLGRPSSHSQPSLLSFTGAAHPPCCFRGSHLACFSGVHRPVRRSERGAVAGRAADARRAGHHRGHLRHCHRGERHLPARRCPISTVLVIGRCSSAVSALIHSPSLHPFLLIHSPSAPFLLIHSPSTSPPPSHSQPPPSFSFTGARPARRHPLRGDHQASAQLARRRQAAARIQRGRLPRQGRAACTPLDALTRGLAPRATPRPPHR